MATPSLLRKLFGDDEAVRKGLLQVYVRVKPVARKLARCMAIEKDALVRATWCVGAPRARAPACSRQHRSLALQQGRVGQKQLWPAP
jgi:hypothetical protein